MEEVQKIALELRGVQAAAEQVQQQLSALQSLLAEATAAANVLSKLPEATAESLFPIGGGVFVRASVSDSKKVLLDIGAGVVAEKSVEEARKALEERIAQLGKASERMRAELSRLAAAADGLSERLSAASRKQGAGNV